MAAFEGGEKMQFVVDSLRANPDIVVVGGIEQNYLETGRWPSPNGYWSHTLDIYTHPVEPLYDDESLNEFMYGLVPEIEPTQSDRARGGGKVKDGLFRSHREELSIGVLYYDECIGTAALSASVELKDGLSVVRSGALAKTWEVSKDIELKQRTWVRVYPNLGHVIDAAQGINQYRIPGEQLGNAQSNLAVAPDLMGSPTLGGFIDTNIVGLEARETPSLEA